MKNRFVKITLTLTMLLVLAVPAQVFAADKNCTFNQINGLNTQVSKIYSQLPQSAVNQLTGVMSQFQNGKIDSAQLQDLMNQFQNGKIDSIEYQNLVNQLCQKTTAKVTTTTPAKETTAVPVKQPTAAPAKPLTEPAKPAATAPAKPAATAPAKPATEPAKPAASTPAANTQTPAETSASLGSYEQQVVNLVNKERAAAGLPALKVNTKLSAVAEKKAEDMRDKNYFSHTSPTYGSPFDMMRQFGISYSTAGENIAKGQRTPAEVMNGWMNSPGHKANILNSSYTEIGVGYVTDSNGNTYWVQQFIRP